MELIRSILNWNYILTVSVTAWLTAQVLKTLINFALIGHLQIDRMWGDGGMPSAHSATVCSMVVAAGHHSGTDSTIFGLACVIAIIIMHDAMGVRYETGEQAKVLNQMIQHWMEIGSQNAPFLNDRKLKEMVGHTPFEVIGGAIVGFAIGFLFTLIH